MFNKHLVVRVFVVLAVIVGLMGLHLPHAAACSCIMPGTPTEEMNNAVAVFAGKVIDINAPLAPSTSMDPVRVHFEVAKVWKGPVTAEMTITTPLDEASCGVTFVNGQEYIVYAHGEENDLQVTLCSRTAPLGSASADLTELGDGTVPQGAGSEPPAAAGPSLVIVLALVVAAIIVIGALAFRLSVARRRA